MDPQQLLYGINSQTIRWAPALSSVLLSLSLPSPSKKTNMPPFNALFWLVTLVSREMASSAMGACVRMDLPPRAAVPRRECEGISAALPQQFTAQKLYPAQKTPSYS